MIYVMSDIHGNKKAFEDILEQIDFNDNDHLYVLGDVVDRQPFGIEILQHIIDSKNIHMILGNHEYMMMDALGFPYELEGCTKYTTKEEKMKQWFMNGGNITYRAWMKLSMEEKRKIRKYMYNLPLKYDINVNGRQFKLVHAVPCELYDIVQDQLIGESRAYFSVWERELIKVFADVENFTTIFGHTPTCHLQNVLPMNVYFNKNIIGIDCGAAYNGKVDGTRLACIRLNDMQIFYSN